MKAVILGVWLCLSSIVVSDDVNLDFEGRQSEIGRRILELSQNQTYAQLFKDTFESTLPRVKEDFPCTIIPPSNAVPTSVHELRPGDINVVAAIGDSLTAGRCAKDGILGLLVDYRGVSWSGGGDGSYETMITLPNILKKYNPNIYGFSTGIGGRIWPNSHLNVARSGDQTEHLLEQAEMLVSRMKNDKNVDFDNDWKVVTIFMGANDLCDHCTDPSYTKETYKANLQGALDYLHAHLPRTFVNVVEVINIEMVKDLHSGLVCQAVHLFACSCVNNAKSPDAAKHVTDLKVGYQDAVEELAYSGRYDTRTDFAVVAQPFYRETYLPRHANGEVDYSYFGADCFHYSLKGQEAAAEALWNNMVEPVGGKRLSWTPGELLECPTETNPYLYTSQNGPLKKVENTK